MSLTVFPDIEQRSTEWYEVRRGIVTASVVGRLLTASRLQPAANDTSRRITAALVAERISGNTDPNYVSNDMWRGIDDEPRARTAYSEHYAPVTEAGFMVRDDWGFRIGYSPDGLVDEHGLIECKSHNQHQHLQIVLADQVPDEHMPQLQCGLLVSGRDWVDYLSYCGGMVLWRKRVLPDKRWFDAILAAVEQFETNAATMVEAYAERTKDLPMTERVVEMGIVV